MSKTYLSSSDIQRMLPHRYPFLLVDEVIELIPGQKGIGIKNVTVNEPCFQGHFPGEPIMPGVLIVEACGQLAGLVKLAELNEDESGSLKKPKIEYLASIQKFNFKQKVVPGNQLHLHAFNFRKVGQLMQVSVQATVKNQLVAEGMLIVTSSST